MQVCMSFRKMRLCSLPILMGILFEKIFVQQIYSKSNCINATSVHSTGFVYLMPAPGYCQELLLDWNFSLWGQYKRMKVICQEEFMSKILGIIPVNA